MKMNRGGSSDSLDNGIGDVISSSSSATDFTSDDELNELYAMSGQQPFKTKMEKPKNFVASGHQRLINDKLLHQSHSNYPQASPLGSTRHNICISADRSVLGPTGNRREFGNLYNNPYNREPSTSFLSDIENANILDNNIDLLYNGRISEQAYGPILPDQTYSNLENDTRQANNTTADQSIRSHPSTRRIASSSPGRSNNSASNADTNSLASSSGFSGYGIFRNRTGFANQEGADDENESLFRRPDLRIIDPHIPAIAGPSRQVNQTVTLMLAKLVEATSLGDAINFVDFNRDLIENLTRVIQEAPAFRNYDMNNYQIDYSVKESFNQEFWLDREPVITTADGNCQYHAVSLSLTGSEMYTQEVRLLTAIAVIDNREWFDSVLKIIDGGTVLDLIHTIARSYSWGDATTLKAIAVAIKRRIFLYTCNIGKKDYEMVKSLGREELLDAFNKKKYRGGTGIHTFADPLVNVSPNNYIMLFHKSEHFIAVLPTTQNPIMYEPYNPTVPTFN